MKFGKGISSSLKGVLNIVKSVLSERVRMPEEGGNWERRQAKITAERNAA